jgi:hypothetical protein
VTGPGSQEAAASSSAGSAGLAADIEAALREVARHLEARDAISAATAVDRLASACAAAAKAGLDDGARTRLQPLLTRCTMLAMETQSTLAATLARLGTGTRANRAYSAE